MKTVLILDAGDALIVRDALNARAAFLRRHAQQQKADNIDLIAAQINNQIDSGIEKYNRLSTLEEPGYEFILKGVDIPV